MALITSQAAADATHIFTVKQTAIASQASLGVLTDVPGLAFSLKAGRRYHFKFQIIFQSAATTSGLGLACTAPAMTIFQGQALIRQAANGTAMLFQGATGTPSTVQQATAAAGNNINYIATYEGLCEPSADGTLQLQFCPEEAQTATVQNAGVGYIIDFG